VKPLMLFALLLLFGSGEGWAAEHHFAWPNHVKAAVSLGYDDALDSQLDNAIPALERNGLRGSFYLTLGGETLMTRLPEWRAVAASGHELGNHTLFHQCSRSAPDREWVTAANDLDAISVEQLLAQIRVGNSMLHAIDGKTERTFTVPCGDMKAGGEDYLPSIEPLFVAIKGDLGGVIPDMQLLDPYMVGVTVPVDVTGEQLIELVKGAAAKGTMINITFHGIGGDYLAVSSQAHEQLLEYLAANKDIYWTDTFITIMKYVKAEQSIH
jgi:peptidoglycan/xylan/chitin deacetylase (PgdA/CDA1 family)